MGVVKMEARTTNIPVAKTLLGYHPPLVIDWPKLTGPKRNEVGVVREKCLDPATIL